MNIEHPLSLCIQDQAIKIIELIAKDLDKLLETYGFITKVRRSDPSIYMEFLGYQKENLELQIVACLHPHDYPYSLRVQLVKKDPHDWKYKNLNELLELLNDTKASSTNDLMIASDAQIKVSIKRLYDIMEIILANNLHTMIK